MVEIEFRKCNLEKILFIKKFISNYYIIVVYFSTLNFKDVTFFVLFRYYRSVLFLVGFPNGVRRVPAMLTIFPAPTTCIGIILRVRNRRSFFRALIIE